MAGCAARRVAGGGGASRAARGAKRRRRDALVARAPRGVGARGRGGDGGPPPLVRLPPDIAALREVLAGEGNPGRLVVLMCCTRSCGPCKMFGPTFELFAEANAGVLFAKINADDNDDFRALCTELTVREVPAFRLFRGGEEVMAPQLRLMPPGLKAAEKVLRATLKEFVSE
eukprot:PRCOL_00007063-RA